MRRSVLTVLCVNLSAMLAACTSDSNSIPRAERNDSAGVSIILNSGVDHPLGWQYRTVRVLGGEDDGPESFYRVARHLVAVDRQGDMVVLDRSSFRAVKLSSAGEFLHAVGREGEGPGEFKRPVAVASRAGGGFAVLDAGRGLYVHFSATGDLIRETRTRSFSSNFHFVDVSLISQRLEYMPDGNRQHLLLSNAADTSTLAITDVAETASYRLEGCGPMPNMAAPVIFAPALAWDANWTSIAVNSEPGYVVTVLNSTGHAVRSIRREIPVQPATTELAVRWAQKNPTRVTSSAGECIFDAQQVVEKRGYASFVPAVGGIALAPDGGMWVRRSAFVADSGRIDVFDPSGQYLGTLPVGAQLPLGFTPSGEIVLVDRDNVDVERVVIAEVMTNDQESD